jgi:AraC family transcriptional regulator
MVQAKNELHQTQGYIDGRRFTDPWPPGLLTFYPQGTRIRAEWKHQSTKAWLEIHEDTTESRFTGVPLRRLPKLHWMSDPLIRDTVLTLSGCKESIHAGESLYREMLITRLIAHLQSPPENPGWALDFDKARTLTPYSLKRAKDFAYDHLTEPVTLEGWAREMGMSPFYFARCFRASTGLSPYQYIIDQRVQLARRLIEMGWSSTAVAGYLCFSSPSHFNVIFKQRTGLSPTEWKDQHLRQNSAIFRSIKAFDVRNFYKPTCPR